MTLLRFTLSLLALLAVLPPVFSADAATYRRLADQAVARGEYTAAADYYRREAEIYRAIGDLDAAKVETMKAERWGVELDMYVDLPPVREEVVPLYSGAKYEPVYGCYLGACLEYDDRLRGGEEGSRDEAFAALLGKSLAVVYNYGRYSDAFPSRWARDLRSRGIAPQIAWEPDDLRRVENDSYLQEWARQAAACGGPIFLRFAGEMNGDWVPYHGSPELYKAKFRLVHDVLERLAPNVAMIWCVNHIPERPIEQYYPGDGYVDWVGVNFYSVYYHDNNRNRLCSWEPPTAFLKYVYAKYAARKPIAICEYGATHRDTVDKGVEKEDFAVAKYHQLFAALPRMFRRVKMVDLFNCNNIDSQYSGRPYNNYCVTDSRRVLEGFRTAVAPDYFLSQPVTGGDQRFLPTHVKELTPGAVLRGTVSLTAWVKTWELRPTVVWKLDGRPMVTLTAPGVYRHDLDTTTLAPGEHTLALVALDSQGREAGRKALSVRVAR